MKRLAYALSCMLLLLPCLAAGQGPASTPAIYSLPNDPTTGTQQYKLAKISNGTLVLATTSDTTVNLFVCLAGCGTQGSALFVVVGEAPCIMDATNASGQSNRPVVASTTTAGLCHVQSAPPTNGIVIGTMVDASTTSGQTSLILAQNQPYIPGSGTGTGSVTNVALTMPGEFVVAGSPITTSGTLAVTEANQAANTVYAGPTSGAAASPGYRALVALDIATALAATTAGGGLTGSYPNPDLAKAAGLFALAGEDTLTLGGDVNDYGLCTKVTCLLNGGATDRNITGFAPPTGGLGAGDLKVVCNTGTTNQLTLKNTNSSSLAANRMLLGDDVRLAPSQCQTLRYQASGTAGWRAVGGGQPDYTKIRPVGVIVGDPDAASPVLTTGNNTPWGWTNEFGVAVKITSMACWASGGAAVIRVKLQGGTDTSLLTGDCTCGTGTTWGACTVQGMAATPPTPPVVNPFAANSATCATAPCGLDFVTVTPNGANYYVIKGRAVLP